MIHSSTLVNDHQYFIGYLNMSKRPHQCIFIVCMNFHLIEVAINMVYACSYL